MKKILTLALLGAMALGAVSCGGGGEETKPEYTVTFNADGGTPAPAAQKVKEGETVTAPPAMTKTGYVFLFWSKDGASAYNFSSPVTYNITLSAHWQSEATAEYWQVTWELNGGAWPADDNHATQVVKGGTLAEPAAPTKSGSTFEGWYKEEALTNKITFPYDVSGVTADFTLYAKWTNEGGTDPVGYTMFTLVSALKAWLDQQPENSAETPYKVGLKGVNLDENYGWGILGIAIGTDKTKFVDLDLSGCTGVTIPDGESRVVNMTVINTGVFLNCENLTAIELTPNLQTIGKNALRGCDNLTSVVLSETVMSIGDNAFYACSELESFDMPNNVATIGVSAFRDCANLVSITLSEELQTIGNTAFAECDKLTSVIIPSKVVTIGSDIFYNSYDLTELVMKPVVPPSLDITLGSNMSFASLTIKVPAASLNAYKAASGWSYYADKIVANTD